eukprot:scaffold1058_cov155-Ochromonas_danica.AAC.51
MSTYEQALLYRDGKIEGISFEDSLKEAEKLFFHLAENGHVKAMHNYASIQFKKRNFDVAYKYFERAGLDASKANCKKMLESGQVSHLTAFGTKEEISLVVGSFRQLKPIPSYLLDQIYGNKVDLTHRKSFGCRAVTIDNHDCPFPSRHIIGDASSYDFHTLYNIKHVLLERLPTCGEQNNKLLLDLLTDNVTGRSIEQLSKAMLPGATLEIEWDPYVALGNFTDQNFDSLLKANPFHAFVHQNVFYAATSEILDPETKAGLKVPELTGTPEFIARVREAAVLLRKEIEYYHNAGADSPATFLKAVSGVQYRDLPVERDGTMVRMQFEDGTYRDGFVCTQTSFTRECFYNFLCASMAVQRNTPLVKKYLESVDFQDVKVERRTNEHNGRKHVWMVTAIKV